MICKKKFREYNSSKDITMIKHDDLINTLMKHAPESRTFPTNIKGFHIVRRNTPHIYERCVVNPVFLMTVQGRKRSVIGNIIYEYGAGQSTVFGMDIPADSCVLDASPEKPYLTMLLELDAALITQISAKLPKDNIDKQNLQAVISSETDPAMFEAFVRLIELLDKPEDIRFLAPLLINEIHYRLLTGALGKHVRAINMSGTPSNQIARAIIWLEKNYKNPLNVEKLAEHADMATSTFHRNFKLITSMSPLQVQKKLRLLEAQRLMLTEGMNTTNAAYKVGYESPTQFNREYKRMFGNSPMKDVKGIILQAS
jgi:AraC-like DNA-binding protein